VENEVISDHKQVKESETTKGEATDVAWQRTVPQRRHKKIATLALCWGRETGPLRGARTRDKICDRENVITGTEHKHSFLGRPGREEK
jgi:hypothetical protein